MACHNFKTNLELPQDDVACHNFETNLELLIDAQSHTYGWLYDKAIYGPEVTAHAGQIYLKYKCINIKFF